MKNKKVLINETAISKIKTDTNSETMVRLNAKIVYHSFLLNSIYTHKKGDYTMKNLSEFKHETLGRVRAIEKRKGEILFCGNDIAKILKHKRPLDAIKKHCLTGVVLDVVSKVVQDEKGREKNTETSENYITLDDTLRLIKFTDKDVARELEKWMYEDILQLINYYGLRNASVIWYEDMLQEAIEKCS